jgi:putative tryptophan/tyrosine transport system substrate-binding protein
MRRRTLLGLLGGTLVAGRAARAQEPAKTARIGVIGTNMRNQVAYHGLLAGLRELGYIAGKNLIVEFVPIQQERSALFAAAAGLVRAQPDMLVALGPELSLQAAISATRTLPIVIVATNYDPIARGYVKGLARPGGNVTGFFIRQPELAEKQVELLTQAFPERTRLALLWDVLSADQFAAAEHRARSLRLTPLPRKLENPPYDFDAAFATLAQDSPDMLLVLSSPNFTIKQDRADIARLALQHRLPSMFIVRSWVEAGGLMSYGYETFKAGRRAASYVAKILGGAKPGDLPVEQPTTFDLVVNLKTAQALGLTMPQTLLARADEVIE